MVGGINGANANGDKGTLYGVRGIIIAWIGVLTASSYAEVCGAARGRRRRWIKRHF